jgi:hypothetical protein
MKRMTATLSPSPQRTEEKVDGTGITSPKKYAAVVD